MVVESEERKKRTEKWRRVFCTPDGKEVLEDIMIGTGIFETINPEDRERVAIRNYGLSVFAELGVFTDKNIPKIVDSLASLGYD